MTLDVYSRQIEIVKHHSQWRVYYLGAEGKKRTADELPGYMADLCHEWSRAGHDRVVKLE